MSIILLTTSIVLILSTIASIAFKITTFQKKMIDETDTLTRVVGYNAASAIMFSDPASATETLGSLQANPEIVAAAIYTKDGNVFSTYFRNNKPQPLPAKIDKNSHTFTKVHLLFFQPIIFKGDDLGTLYVKSDLNKLATLIRQDLIFMLLLLLFCLAVAFMLSSKMQKAISGPILNLVNTTKIISENKDYSTRAQKSGNDEVGVLVDAFNFMIEKIQAHDALIQAKEKYFRTLIENATDIITIINREGIITYQSPSVERILGYQPSEIIGKNFFSFIYPKELEYLKKALRFSKDNLLYNPYIKLGVTLKDKDGMWRLLEGVFHDLHDDPNVKGMVINIRDVIDRKKFEDRLKRSIAVKNEFLSHVCSQVRKPIANIKAALLLYQHKKLKKTTRSRLISITKSNMERLDTMLTGNILDITKFEIGRMELQRQSIDVIKTIKEICEDLQFITHNLEIPVNINSQDSYVFLSVDKLAFTLILSTLIKNAIAVTPKQHPITIDVESTVDTCRICVTDQGPGIARRDMPALYRKSHNLTRRFANEEIPLGLDDVRTLVEQQQGTFSVSSEVGKGSSFSFTIPVIITGFEY